jgi:hypothetical protein
MTEEGATMQPGRTWIEQCEAARGIEDQFGTGKALDYLVGEKFLDFLEAAEARADLREDIPAFVAEIRAIFEPWRLAEHLETARHTERFDAGIYDEEDDPGLVEDERRADIRRCAGDLLVVERAREWLLGEGG